MNNEENEKKAIEERRKAEIEYDKLIEIEREIKTNLNDSLTSYSFGAKTREDVEKQIKLSRTPFCRVR